MAVVLSAFAAQSTLPAHASSARLGPWDVDSLFFISKSENHNQVHYGVRLDAACKPVGPRPVFAYWRMLEEGPTATAPLLDREQAAYGLDEAQVVFGSATSPRVRIRLRSFPDRPIVVRPELRGDHCVASVVCDIRGEAARLERIHVVIGMFWSVRSVTLEGMLLGVEQPTFEVLRD